MNLNTDEDGFPVILSVISLASLVCNAILRIAVSGAVTPDTLVHDLTIATTIVLMSPWKGEGRSLSLVFAGFCTGCGLLLSGLGDAMHESLRHLLYLVIVTAPLWLRLACRTVKLVFDKDFMTGMVLGWEVVLVFLNAGMVHTFLAYVCMAYAVIAFDSPVVWDWLSVVLAGLLYALLLVRSITRKSVSLRGVDTSELADAEAMALPFNLSATALPKRYRRLYVAMCLLLKEKKPYLDSGYKIEDMARQLGTNRAYLSKMINSTPGNNFKKLVNACRVNYAMELFNKDSSLKVVELCQMSGFNNRATFKAAFDMFTGMSPRDWCDEQRRKMLAVK